METEALPLLSPKEIISHFSNKAPTKGPRRALVELSDFIDMLEAVGGFSLNRCLGDSSIRI